MTAVSSTQQEVSGFGAVTTWREMNREINPFKISRFKAMPEEKPYGFLVRVEDIWPLDIGSAALTEIDSQRNVQFIQERHAEGTDLASLKLWWHRHPLSSGWSSIDEYAAQRTPMGLTPKQIDWHISIVYCTDTGWNGRFDQHGNVSFTIHCPVLVEGQPQSEELLIQHAMRGVKRGTRIIEAEELGSRDKFWTGTVADIAPWADWGANTTQWKAPKKVKQERDGHTLWSMLLEDELGEADFDLSPERHFQLVQYLVNTVDEIIEDNAGKADYDKLYHYLQRAAERFRIDEGELLNVVMDAWGPDGENIAEMEEALDQQLSLWE